MSFDKLLADLAQAGEAQETLSKALPAEDGKDDDKIQAAAGEGGSGDGGADDGVAGEGDDADVKKDDEGKPLTKSMKVTLADGSVVDAEDGTELVKSLTARLATAEEALTKSVGGLMGMVKSQGEMIKSLGEQVTKLRGEGRGRKAVVTLSDKSTTLAKSEPQGISSTEFMAKAMSAQQAGRLTGLDISIAETCLNSGKPVPESIVNRVIAQQ